MALADPLNYQLQGQILEGSIIHQRRDQFIGSMKGLEYLEALLDNREMELREVVKSQDNKAR